MENKIRWTQIELPSLHLVWKRENEKEIICSVIRTNYPKPGLIFIPAIVEKTCLCDVKTIDMKIRDQDTIIPYRKFKYEKGEMIASRMGVPFEKVKEDLKNTDILGLSVNTTSWTNIAIDFMKFAKKVNPNIKIVMGGNEATFRSEFFLKPGLVDIAMLGEAEKSLPILIKALKEKTDLKEVRGLAFLENGEIIKTGMPEKPKMEEVPLQALDLLKDDIPLWTTPIEYFPLPKGVSKPIGFIFFTRGCYQNCEYCTSPRKMGMFRFNSLDKIAKELDFFKKYGITTLNIWDDSLTSVMYPGALGREDGRKYLMNLVKLLKDKGFAFEFSQGMVIKDLWDREKEEPDFELINALYSNEIKDGKFVGCYGEYFPTEFLQVENPTDRCAKLEGFEVEKRILKAILDAGTKLISYSSIMGSNDDVPEGFIFATKRLKELQEFVKERGGSSLATPFVFSTFPGTRLWDSKKMELKFDIDKFPELYQLNAAPQRTPHFKPHEIMLKRIKMEKELMSTEEHARWQSTGRYQWPKVKV
jgi:hypothetical protein